MRFIEDESLRGRQGGYWAVFVSHFGAGSHRYAPYSTREEAEAFIDRGRAHWKTYSLVWTQETIECFMENQT